MMPKLLARLTIPKTAYKVEIKEKLALSFAERRVSRGEALRSGDLATGDDGHIYEVESRPEKLLHIETPAPREAAIVGYVLGNGHVPAEIGKGYVRIAYVAELAEAFPSLGVTVSEVEAPFEPNLGDAPHHHDHAHDHHHDHHDHDH